MNISLKIFPLLLFFLSLDADEKEGIASLQNSVTLAIKQGASFNGILSTHQQNNNPNYQKELKQELLKQWTALSVKDSVYRFKPAQDMLQSASPYERGMLTQVVLHQLVLAHTIPNEDYEQNADLIFLNILHLLSDRQVLTYMKASLKNSRSPFSFDYPYLSSRAREKFEHIFLLIRRSEQRELLELFAFRVFPYLSRDKKEELCESLKETYDPFAEFPPIGPLFSRYVNTYPQADICIRTMPSYAPNFSGLLPLLAEYCAGEYQKDHLLFFHGQSAIWIFYQEIYRALYRLTHKKSLCEFLPLRFKKHSAITPADINDFHEKGNWTNRALTNELLWVNLHPAANHASANSFYYATENYDQFSQRDRLDEALIQQIFAVFDLEKVYERIKKVNPAFFLEIKHLFDEAIHEQGDHGQLVVISLPKSLANCAAYSTNTNAQRAKVGIYSLSTSSPVTASQKFNQMPFSNEWLLMLIEELINPESASAAGVKIVGFDPVRYWRTEKWVACEQKLEQLINLIKKIS